MDVATGAAVAADDNDAVGTVVPPSSTMDEDTNVSACVKAFTDGAGKSAAASVLLTPRCRCHAVRRRRALHCRHRHAAAKLPPMSRCCAAATAKASMLLQPRCRRRAVHYLRASRYRHRC